MYYSKDGWGCENSREVDYLEYSVSDDTRRLRGMLVDQVWEMRNLAQHIMNEHRETNYFSFRNSKW